MKGKELVISDVLKHELIQFMANHNVKALSRGVRTMLIEYTAFNTAGLPHDFKEQLFDFRGLFVLLDALEDEDISSSR